MSNSHQKSTGTGYTAIVGFLIMGLVFIPAVLIMSRPSGYVAWALAIACSAVCVTLAWVNWKTSSQLSIPSIEIPVGRAK